MARVTLPVHSYAHSSRPVGCERLVNCFAERAPPEGKAPVSLMRSPGLRPFASFSGNPTARGIFAWNGALYAGDAQFFYSVTSAPTATLLGLITGNNRATFGVNSHQLVICCSPDAFVWDGTTFSQITDPDYTSRGGAQCSSLDNYILFREPNSGRFFCSDLDDALSYDALNFATAEGYPDNIIGMIVDHRQIVLAGSNSIELWVNVGSSGFPFARDSNGFLEIGCAAGDTFAKADNSIYWLADDLTVRRLDGYTPVRVSQHGVEQAIRTYTVSDAYAFGYTQDGHVFYVLTFPTSAHTWVLDVTTGEWHERASYGNTRWTPSSTANAFGKVFVQSSTTAHLSSLDPDYYQDFSDPVVNPTGILRSEWTYGSVYNAGHRTFHSNFQVLAETGVGLTVGQGSAPEMGLDVSDDGGRTWRAMPNKSLGAIGRYRNRVRWQRLGSSRDRVYRNWVSDPVKVTVADAELEVT